MDGGGEFTYGIKIDLYFGFRTQRKNKYTFVVGTLEFFPRKVFESIFF